MDHDVYTKANARAWEEASFIHRRKVFEKLKLFFGKDSGSLWLDRATKRILEHIDLKDKKIFQPGCNNGKELISLERMGAASCTGIDISEGFIEQAKELSAHVNARCVFICGDIMNYELNKKFDMVFVSVGFIQWISDLNGLVKKFHSILNDGGLFVFTDYHPVATMFDKQDAQPNLAVWNYFDDKPEESTSGLDYVDGVKIPYKTEAFYYFKRTLSGYIQACINNGFTLQYLEEYPFDVSSIAASLEQMDIGIPLSFGMIFKKT